MVLEIVYLWNVFFIALLLGSYALNRPSVVVSESNFFNQTVNIIIWLVLPVMAIIITSLSARHVESVVLEGVYYFMALLFAYLSFTQIKLVHHMVYKVILGAVALVVAIQVVQHMPTANVYVRYGSYFALYGLLLGLAWMFKRRTQKVNG